MPIVVPFRGRETLRGYVYKNTLMNMDPISRRARSLAGLFLAAGLLACTAASSGVAETQPDVQTRRPVNLVEALDQLYQAGGEIVVVAAKDGTPLAARRSGATHDREQELAIRREAWEIARKVNLSRQPGEINPRSLPLAPQHIALLERFALGDAGAVWFRHLTDDTLRLFNAGHLAYDAAVWQRLRKQGQPVQLSRLLTGRLTEKGLFAREPQVFKFYGFTGHGALAEPASIGLGDAGFRCRFPDGGQEVDPHAILSHEFGHTRYGDPSSALSLEGEARTVEQYENPVRLRNGYEPRLVYYLHTEGNTAEGRAGAGEQVFNWQSRTKINVDDRQVTEELHCDCFQPVSLLALDCERRRLPDADGFAKPRYESTCKPSLRLPDKMGLPLLDQNTVVRLP